MRVHTPENVGASARQRRLDLKLTQAEVARRADVTRQWLVGFEGGKSDVSLTKAFAVLRELDLIVRIDPPQDPLTSHNGHRVVYTIPKIEMPQLDIESIRRSLKQISSQEVFASALKTIEQLNAARRSSEGHVDG